MLSGQAPDFTRGQWIAESGNRPSYQQWTLLPVMTQEMRRRHAAQELHFHRRNYSLAKIVLLVHARRIHKPLNFAETVKSEAFPMHIAKNRVVTLDVELSDIWGNLIEHPEEPVQYLHGAYGDIFPVVEAALEGKAPNDRIDLRLEPEDAHGDYDENLLLVEPLEKFPEGLEVGMRIETDARPGEGDEEDVPGFCTVTDIAQGKVILDGNHPLAGIALRFVATVVEVRPATQAEIDNGAADDPSSIVLRALP